MGTGVGHTFVRRNMESKPCGKNVCIDLNPRSAIVWIWHKCVLSYTDGLEIYIFLKSHFEQNFVSATGYNR